MAWISPAPPGLVSGVRVAGEALVAAPNMPARVRSCWVAFAACTDIPCGSVNVGARLVTTASVGGAFGGGPMPGGGPGGGGARCGCTRRNSGGGAPADDGKGPIENTVELALDCGCRVCAATAAAGGVAAANPAYGDGAIGVVGPPMCIYGGGAAGADDAALVLPTCHACVVCGPRRSPSGVSAGAPVGAAKPACVGWAA